MTDQEPLKGLGGLFNRFAAITAAEALREAADNIVILNEGICPSCRTNAEAEAETWLRARADDYLEKK